MAEDLLAHGLLESHPVLAAVFVSVVAVNAAALYLALTNIIVDLRVQEEEHLPDAHPSFMMLGAAGLSLLIGLMPRPFVATAAQAHDVLAGRIVASPAVLSSQVETSPTHSARE